MNEIKKRWNAPTPKFWQKVRKFGIVIGTLGGILVTIPATVVIAPYLITAGGVIAVLSQLTVEQNVETNIVENDN
jgi:uncharacterized BrkB/YihY/UPF0761 family membrane protein